MNVSEINNLNKCQAPVPLLSWYWKVMVSIWMTLLLELLLCTRQMRALKLTRGSEVPKCLRQGMTQETFDKAWLYSRDKLHFSLLSHLIRAVVLTICLHYEVLFKLWLLQDWIINAFQITVHPSLDFVFVKKEENGVIFLVLCFTAYIFFTDLPLSIISTFVLEEKNGFNNQTPSFFFRKLLKNCSYLFAATFPFVVTPYSVYICLALPPVTYYLMPEKVRISVCDYILPRKYKPLREGSLRTNLEAIGFPKSNIFYYEESISSSHTSVRIFPGLRRADVGRVSFSDTLISSYNSGDNNEGEEEGVLPHDAEIADKGFNDIQIEAMFLRAMGHFRLNHSTLILSISLLSAMLVVLLNEDKIALKTPELFEAFGFPKSFHDEDENNARIVGIVILPFFFFRLFSILFFYGVQMILRLQDGQADAYAVLLGYGGNMRQGFVKMAKDNLKFPCSDRIYSMCCEPRLSLTYRLQEIDDEIVRNRAAIPLVLEGGRKFTLKDNLIYSFYLLGVTFLFFWGMVFLT